MASTSVHILDRALGLDRVDLHLHTTVSDGKVLPEGIIELAEAHRLEAVAITDHDAADAFDDVAPGVKPSGLLLITGVEIDTDGGDCGPEILGYGFDHTDTGFRGDLLRIQRRRMERARRLIREINHVLGAEALSDEEVFAEGRKAILKPHLTDPLVEKGFFPDTAAARAFIAEKVPKVPFEKPSTEQAVKMVRKAGGKAVLAHPGFLLGKTDMDGLLRRLAAVGLYGLEGDYPYPPEAAEANRQVAGMAKQHGLVLTRGTDSHTEEDWDRRHRG